MLFVLALLTAVAHGCVDSVPSCPMLAQQCHISVVELRCPVTCNSCATPAPTPGGTPAPVTGGSAPAPPVAVCKDVSVSSCTALANNPANYCVTNPLVPQKCPVSCGLCTPITPSPVIVCAAAPPCGAACNLSDTNGDGCVDTCICPCPTLTCSGILAPFDSNGDGCTDTCVSNCPNHATKKICNKDKANRCKYNKKKKVCEPQECSSQKSAKKCKKLAGCSFAANVCYDQNSAPPAPVTVACDTYPAKNKCNRDSNCKWSTKQGGSCQSVVIAPAVCASNTKRKACVSDPTCLWTNSACIDASGPAPVPQVDCSVLSKGACNSEPACVYDKSRAKADRCYDPVCPLADVQAVYQTIKRQDALAYQGCVDFFENGQPGICTCLKGLQASDTAGLDCLARVGESDTIADATATCHSGTAACLGPKNVLDCATMSASQFGPCIWDESSSSCGVHDGSVSSCSTTDFLLDSTSVINTSPTSQTACGNVANGVASGNDMCDCLDSFDSPTAAKYAWCTLPGSTFTGFEEYGKCQ